MISDSDEESSGSHCSFLETESDESDSDATVIYDVGSPTGSPGVSATVPGVLTGDAWSKG